MIPSKVRVHTATNLWIKFARVNAIKETSLVIIIAVGFFQVFAFFLLHTHSIIGSSNKTFDGGVQILFQQTLIGHQWFCQWFLAAKRRKAALSEIKNNRMDESFLRWKQPLVDLGLRKLILWPGLLHFFSPPQVGISMTAFMAMLSAGG